jgi:ribulose-phosphate 3-epimerase
MPKTTKIIPAILASNKIQFTKQWHQVARYFSYVQIDIMDGIFVKTKNDIIPQSIKALSRQHKLEIHLMTKDVPKYINKWLELKNIKKIIWHYEADKNIKNILDLNKYLKSQKIQTGLAINPNTSLAKIKNIIPDFHTIQIMGVTPGKQGQRFQSKVLTKIKALHKKYSKTNIAIDGGVTDRNIKQIKKAGANLIAVGSYLQKSSNIKQSIQKLK